jgi:hypothetical protein
MKPEVDALMRVRFVTFIFKHCFHYVFPVGFVCGTWLRLRKMSKWLHEGIVQPLAMRLGSFGQNGFARVRSADLRSSWGRSVKLRSRLRGGTMRKR